MPRVQLEGYECARCGHRWVKREATEGDPIICPKCKSPYWDRPRKNPVANQRAIKESKIHERKVKGDNR